MANLLDLTIDLFNTKVKVKWIYLIVEHLSKLKLDKITVHINSDEVTYSDKQLLREVEKENSVLEIIFSYSEMMDRALFSDFEK